MNFKHGMHKSPEYQAWINMRHRCKGSREAERRLYKDRGIRVCRRWRTFEAFFADVGPRPSPRHSLDRIRNAEGYKPGNVRWATQAQQMRNTRRTRLLTVNGTTLPAKDWAAKVGLDYNTLWARLALGWPVDLAVLTPSPAGAKLATLLKRKA